MASSASITNFERSISLNDLDTALEVRELIEKDIVISKDGTSSRFLRDTPRSNFVFPKLSEYAVDYRKFIASYLVDTQIYKDLQTTKQLNWCSSVCSLVPILTMGDGNCLMHAASLGMWAVNDRFHTLRKTVYEALLEDSKGIYHMRWKREQEVIKSSLHGNFEMTEDQWQAEWDIVLQLVSQMEFPNGRNGTQYGSLEEIHIFVLANVLRRTIIVISDDTLRGNYGEPLSPINFGGVYLPLQCDPVDCVKTPLVIGYCQGHFTAVVGLEDGKLDLGLLAAEADQNSHATHAIPLVKHDESPLQIHFLFSDEQKQAGGLLRQYLDCLKISLRSASSQGRETNILAARLHHTESPECIKKLISKYFKQARSAYEHMLNHRSLEMNNPSLPHSLLSGPQACIPLIPCCTKGCEFFGSQETANYCSTCFNKYLKSLSNETATAIQSTQPANAAGLPQLSMHLKQQQMPVNEELQQQLETSQPNQTGARPKQFKVQKPQATNCSTENCKYYAAMDLGGLCVRCYEAERIAKETLSSVNSASVPCANKVNGCQYFGQAEMDNLCSYCFVKFKTQMEKHAELQQSPSPSVSPSPTPKLCVSPGCTSNSVAALYNRCVFCYANCIKAFINSDGKSVAVASSAAPSHSSAGTKGNLCATPGCLEERVPHLNDLCYECYGTKVVKPNSSVTQSTPLVLASTKSSSTMSTNSSEIVTVQSQCPTSPKQGSSNLLQGGPQGMSASSETTLSQSNFLPHNNTAATTVIPQSPNLTSTLHNAAGSVIYCSNYGCMNPIGSSTGNLCPKCTGKSSAVQTLPPQAVSRTTAAPVIYCKVRGCKEPTSPKQHEFCLTHFLVIHQKENEFQTMPSAQRSPPSTAAGNALTAQLSTSSHQTLKPHDQSITPVASTGIRCPTPGCTFYGAADKNFLCSECYNYNITEWCRLASSLLVPQQSQPKITQSLEVTKTSACPITGCQNRAAPHCNGLCNQCYQSAVTQELRQWASEPKASEQRVEKANKPQSLSATKVVMFPCLGKGCLLYIPKAQGYCDSCLRKKAPDARQQQSEILQGSEHARRQAFGTIQNTPTHSPTQVTPSQALNDQPPVEGKCRQYGCRMFGSNEYEGYCSKCFKELFCGQYPDSVIDQVQRNETSDSPRRVILAECINAGCSSPSNPRMHNHCTKCFERLNPEFVQ